MPDLDSFIQDILNATERDLGRTKMEAMDDMAVIELSGRSDADAMRAYDLLWMRSLYGCAW